jgi:hypothetical protein
MSLQFSALLPLRFIVLRRPVSPQCSQSRQLVPGQKNGLRRRSIVLNRAVLHKPNPRPRQNRVLPKLCLPPQPVQYSRKAITS